MRRFFKWFFIIVALVVHGILATGINYVFPSYAISQITGVEVKRVDKDGPISKSNPADGPTRDVYYIYTQDPKTEKVMVYRNEDTRWGFPFYFKFDSANIQAKAQALANEKALVEVKYYGWRITMLDEFSNVVSLKEISPEASVSRPIISYILYVVLLFTLFLSIQFVRGWFDSE
ncbi:DUF1523 family protein [Gallibacterium trehalosifermentans]|uniref:DUF1523 family protein n=1 Tax=Gallibacterium trehalosifermentans TaxID=516935 RepID=A0ABV6GXZ5_9PAST